jgi:hypothetical protein
VPADDQATTPAQQRHGVGGNRAGLDVRVVDDRLDGVTTVSRRDDLVDLRHELALHNGKDQRARPP